MIQSRQDYLYYLERDRQSMKMPKLKTWQGWLKDLFFPHYEWKFIKSLRYLEYCENVKKKHLGGVIFWFVAKYRFRKISVKLGFSIPINVFGPGLSLPHRGNIIVNPKTHIGENCRIHVGVNIGANHDKTPRIGNNVYIGPGAIIFGDIEIADNCFIGANATVNKSVMMPNCVVAGTPAKVLKMNVLSWNGIKPINNINYGEISKNNNCSC